MSYLFIKEQLKKGNSLARAYQNNEFFGIKLHGIVLDVGGGRNPDYFKYFNIDDVKEIIPIDGSITGINFENDSLPREANSADSIVCTNLLEHIFNYQFLSDEMYRVVKKGGSLVGSVPFLINYHPDPSDYFRYSKESLKKIFEKSGFISVEIIEVGLGPFLVSLNTIILSLPKFIRIPLFAIAYLIDSFYVKKGIKIKERFPLAYVFLAKK